LASERNASSAINRDHDAAAMPPNRPEELLLALLRSAYHNAGHGPVVRHRPTTALKLTGARLLSYLAASRTRPIRPTQVLRVSATVGSARGYASSSNKPLQEPAREQIAVLGGGITGLTAAHYLARQAPDAHITLYEASDRLGGWIDGRPTPVHQNGGGEVLLQRGPRMLRSGASSTKYDDLVLYDVVGPHPTLAFRAPGLRERERQGPSTDQPRAP
jgi:protoporphyrinogen/coproporphyrinogen III oxidase